jgi:hypothetical protein
MPRLTCRPADRRRLLAEQELEAARFERGLQHVGGGLVELALHDPVAKVHHRHVHAAQLEPIRRFEAKQAGADYHRVLEFAGGGDHLLGVGNVAVAEHTVEIVARNRRNKGCRAGGKEQAVVGSHSAVLSYHFTLDAVDFGDRLASVQRDAVLLVPGKIVQHDVLQRHLAGQYGREQDAVVVAVRLAAEDRDLVELGRNLEQFFERPAAGHAVADHHQFEFFHCITSGTIPENRQEKRRLVTRGRGEKPRTTDAFVHHC